MLLPIIDTRHVILPEYVGMFFNPVDVTCAFLGVMRPAEIAHLLDKLAREKPFSQFRDTLKSSRIQNHVRTQLRGYHHKPQVPNWSFFSEGDPVKRTILQLVFHAMVSRPLIELAPEQERTSIISNASHTPRALSLPLNAFYQRASQTFENYNQFTYENFKTEIQKGMLDPTTHLRKASFGLYLLMHDDLRIHLLSLAFSEQDPTQLRNRVPFLNVSLTNRNGQDASTVLEDYLTKDLVLGSVALHKLGLHSETLYQPRELWGTIFNVIGRVGQVYTTSIDHLKITTAHEVAREHTLVLDLESHLRTSREQEEHLRTQIKKLDHTIITLRAQPPEYYRDIAYCEMERRVAELESQKQEIASRAVHAETQLVKSRTENTTLRQKNDRFKTIITEKQEAIDTLTCEYNKVHHDILRLKIVPSLNRFYGNKVGLIITRNRDRISAYEGALGQIFGIAEVRVEEAVAEAELLGSDIIILAADGTAHQTRFSIEKLGKKVVVYPHGPSQILQFLYDNYLPRNYKPE